MKGPEGEFSVDRAEEIPALVEINADLLSKPSLGELYFDYSGAIINLRIDNRTGKILQAMETTGADKNGVSICAIHYNVMQTWRDRLIRGRAKTFFDNVLSVRADFADDLPGQGSRLSLRAQKIFDDSIRLLNERAIQNQDD